MCTFRIVTCPSCDGDGQIYFGHPNDPDPPSTPCPNCKGECCVVVDVEFCTEGDLDEQDEAGIIAGEELREGDAICVKDGVAYRLIGRDGN